MPTSFSGSTSTPADLSQGKRQSTTLAPDGAGVDAVPGANLSNLNLTMAYLVGADLQNAGFSSAWLTDADFTAADIRGAFFANFHFGDATGITLDQLYSTSSYQAHDLSGIALWNHNLAGGNFAGQNLANAIFKGAALTGADFTGAEVRGADFGLSFDFINFDVFGTGIVLDQLYSTASYQAHDLSGIFFLGSDLAGGNFAGHNLANAFFQWAALTGANFTAADARGAYLDVPAGAIATNLIKPDGHISGLDLGASGLLIMRDYDGNTRYEPARPPIPITIDQHIAMAPGGTLRMVFEADAWDSTISFAPGIPVTLGGTLQLTFAADVNPATQLGRTFDLFDWTGVVPVGAFDVTSPYRWDLAKLYTTGEVTLAAVPEPACIALAAAGAFGLIYYQRRRLP